MLLVITKIKAKTKSSVEKTKDLLKSRSKSTMKIGPHNKDIISIIIGALLGDGHLEKRINGRGTRVKFEQSEKNMEYLMWFHNYLATRGYCRLEKPVVRKIIKKNGLVFFHYSINSYSFVSFNWIHEMFYKRDFLTNKLIKIIPLNLEEYLTPFVLAIWFMDDGSKLGKGAKIAVNCFNYSEIEFLSSILKRKYKLDSSIHKAGKGKKFTLYIPKKSMTVFSSLVKPWMLPSMTYKLGDY
jgi:ubiquinol-cytochrome c reductase cytochrome b subunit